MNGLDGLSPAEIISRLDLKPHPEGGHYLETFRDFDADASGRARSTAIYFLLVAGEISAWHRIDAVEVWHHYAGAPLALTLSPDGEKAEAHTLGSDFGAGEAPQVVVPQFWWQTAAPLGAWTLVGCTVAPGFDFAGFEMAQPGWLPASLRSGAA